MEARYLRVKNWATFQHYKDKEPGWIKLYATTVRDSTFLELSEPEQWQLVRVWVAASQSSRFTLDEKERRVPVVPDDEQYLRRATASLKKIPLARFIREGWLIPIAEDELETPSPALDTVYTEASPGLDPTSARSRTTKALEVKEKGKGFTEARPPALGSVEQPSLGSIIDLSLREAS